MSKYNILFNLSYKSGEFTAEDLKKYSKEDNLCDSFLFIPIYKNKGGVLGETLNFHTFDGKNNTPIDENELFTYWAAFGYHISKCEKLSQKQKEIAKWAYSSIADESKTLNH